MTRTLFLLRHAKSSWDDPALADHDRPLAPRGRRAAALMADHLRARGIAPTLVLCSSSMRTRETLEAIADGLAGKVETRIEDGLYGAPAADLLVMLRELRGSVESVMLIGHQPAIQDLAVYLVGADARPDAVMGKFPTGALATLSFTGSWSGLAAGTAELVEFVKPRDLEG